MSNDPTYARAKELFLIVDGMGDSVYSFEEIVDKLKSEGYETPHKTTVIRWAQNGEWKKEREALITHALTEKRIKTIKKSEGEGIRSIEELARYINKMGEVNKGALNILEKWVMQTQTSQIVSAKEVALATKIVEATGKIHEKFIDKLTNTPKPRENAQDIFENIKEGIEVEIKTV